MRPIPPDRYTATLKEANQTKKKPAKIIELLFENKMSTRDMPSSSGAYELHGIFRGVKQIHQEKKSFYNFVHLLAKKNIDILSNGSVIKSLFVIHSYKDWWVRPIESWKKDTYNLERQIKSIARYLFCDYPIPKFLDNIWFARDLQMVSVELFMHLGKGGSPRTFEGLRVPLTKKESHYFLNAPENYDLDDAVIWAKTRALGGDERMVGAFMESRIFNSLKLLMRRRGTFNKNSDEYNKWQFWETIIRFFIEQQMLDGNLVAPLCDYINHVKYESRQTPQPGGGWKYLPPQNPDFKINGRTITALVRGMEVYHRELGTKQRHGTPKAWSGFEIEDFKVSYGKDAAKKTYSFTQLLTASSLRIEGSAHGHCVAGYANSCNNGRTSIWSMCVSDFTNLHKHLLTIEVSTDYRIVQCRGKANRLATAKEWRIVEEFARQRRLGFSRWVGRD